MPFEAPDNQFARYPDTGMSDVSENLCPAVPVTTGWKPETKEKARDEPPF
jgi:hypothetical protein